MLQILRVVTVMLLANAVYADDNRSLPLWRVSGVQNDIYLLGSVHMLRASDYPLPAGVYAAYDDAESLVMELDMDDLDPADAARLVSELGIIPGDDNLGRWLGPVAFERAKELADLVVLNLAQFERNEPWLAAVLIEQQLLGRLGFNPALGVENHLLTRAVKDGKPVTGLETLREQFEILDQLPLDAQSTLFLETLEDAPQLESTMNDLIRAWLAGDMAVLESTVLDDMRDQPALFRELVVNRNQGWSEKIAKMRHDADDYLVIVGTLHLVGPEGLPALLTKRGFDVEQQ